MPEDLTPEEIAALSEQEGAAERERLQRAADLLAESQNATPEAARLLTDPDAALRKLSYLPGAKEAQEAAPPPVLRVDANTLLLVNLFELAVHMLGGMAQQVINVGMPEHAKAFTGPATYLQRAREAVLRDARQRIQIAQPGDMPREP